MKHRESGFTLPETLIATALLVSGLAGVAWVFTKSIGVNMDNRHRAVGAVLAAGKLEEFEGMAWSDPRWSAGGGLDPTAPIEGYSDTVIQIGETYLRLWEITGVPSRTVRVSVYVRPNGGARIPPELIRASTVASPGF